MCFRHSPAPNNADFCFVHFKLPFLFPTQRETRFGAIASALHKLSLNKRISWSNEPTVSCKKPKATAHILLKSPKKLHIHPIKGL
jgi:hypothetical protein